MHGAKKLLEPMRSEARNRLSELAQTIALHNGSQPMAALQTMVGNAGKAHVEAIQNISLQLLAADTARI